MDQNSCFSIKKPQKHKPIPTARTSSLVKISCQKLLIQNSPVILWFDLKQIATQTILEVSSTEKCAVQHTKSPKKFLGGKCKTFLPTGDCIIREF